MKQIAFIFLLVFISSCKKGSINNKLPNNSATLLLQKSELYVGLNKSSPRNVDIINGFRSLKLNTKIDSLYLVDWAINKYSPNINYFNKEIPFQLDGQVFKSEVNLTFYMGKLVMIDIELDDSRGVGAKKYTPNDAENTVVEPEIMNLFYSVFGDPIKVKDNQFVSKRKLEKVQDTIDDFWSINRDNFDYVEKITLNFPKRRFVKIPYELVENKYVGYMPKDDTNKGVQASVFYPINNISLLVYEANFNKLKLLIQNKFETIKSKGGDLFVFYRLRNIKLQIKIYKEKPMKEYLLEIEKQRLILSKELKRETLKDKKINDSLKLKNSLKDF